ncbi:hypothetical protein, partial [Methanocaldococcus infernus]
MRKITLFLLFLLSLGGVNGLVIAEVNYSFYFTGELVNNNPYPVFIGLPYKIDFEEKSLSVPKSALEVNISKINNTLLYTCYLHTYHETNFNGIKGIWLYPYSSKKIIIYSDPIVKQISVSDNLTEYSIIGPVVYNKIDVINLHDIFKNLRYRNVEIKNFKMYVSGYIKKENTETLSIIFPIPVMFNRYSQFFKIKPDLDIWTTYDKWYYHQIKNVERLEEIKSDDPLIPESNIDNPLIPKGM